MSDDNISTNGWWQRVEAKHVVADQMVGHRKHCSEAWNAAGFAVEFALKAVISKKRRYNRWPDDPDLRTHDLRKLMGLAGIKHEDLSASLRTRFQMAVRWDRQHDYRPTRMPRKEARDMYKAVFGNDGIVQWLKTQ